MRSAHSMVISQMVLKHTCLLNHSMLQKLYREIFKDTAIMISEEGERYLGGAIGTISFIQQYVQTKVDGWIKDIQKLSEFATTQPQAAYAALTHGLISRWNYLLRVIDWERLSSDELLQPLETAIQSQFIPAITGQAPPGQQVREILALPVRLGGLGLQNPMGGSRTKNRVVPTCVYVLYMPIYGSNIRSFRANYNNIK